MFICPVCNQEVAVDEDGSIIYCSGCGEGTQGWTANFINEEVIDYGL